MKWRNLNEFRVIAQLENVTLASQQLYTSQPALSRMLRNLESELGVPMFTRDNKKLQLTEKGSQLLEFVQRINAEESRLREDLQRIRESRRPSLCILCQVYIDGLDSFLVEFQRQYPNIRLTLLTDDSSDPTSSERYDFVITGFRRSSAPGTSRQLLLEEALVVAVSSRHPLASYPSVHLEELRSENWISSQFGTDLWNEIQNCLEEAGVELSPYVTSDDCRVIQEMVADGLGVSIVPLQSYNFQRNPRITLLPIAGPRCTRSIYLCWRDDRPLSQEACAFLDVLQNFQHLLF